LPFAAGRDISSRKFNPDQPRVPAGEPGGGRWTDGDVVVAGFPRIPKQRPPTAKERHAIIKAVSVWLADSGLAAANFVARGSWLHDAFPAINAYLDAPRSLGELHDLVATPERGYDIHHIVEQTPASRDGFSRTLIDREDNLVRVPTLKHWQINAWFQRPNDEFDGQSPKEYLQYKDWDERRRVGLRALIIHGVLAP
jgi:hypothetical protein